MHRTIPELIAALFAGDPITPTDAKRLQRHMRHQERIDKLMLRDVSPEDRERSEAAEMGAEFRTYRAKILRDLRKFTVPELRGVVRQTLVLIGALVEMLAAHEGTGTRRRRQFQRGARRVTASRVQQRAAVRRAVEALKAKKEQTTKAAVRLYLREHDADWWATATDGERNRKVAAWERRIRRAKRKSGRSPG